MAHPGAIRQRIRPHRQPWTPRPAFTVRCRHPHRRAGTCGLRDRATLSAPAYPPRARGRRLRHSCRNS